MATLRPSNAGARVLLIVSFATSDAHADEVMRLLDGMTVTPASAAAVTARCDDAVALATRLRRALETDTRPANVERVLRPYDTLVDLLYDAGSVEYLVKETHPAPAVRDAAAHCYQRLADSMVGVSLSRPIRDRLAAIPTGALDARTRHVLERVLLEYHLAGADRDAATRARVATLQQRITEAALAFGDNIRDAKDETVLDSAEDLDGLPSDYVAAHPPRQDGKIHVGIDYPDVTPVLQYADKESTRKAVFYTFANRAWPANAPVLRELLNARAELAQTLGYGNYAQLALADKMATTPERAERFLDEAYAAAKPSLARLREQELARWRKVDPTATDVHLWNSFRIENWLRQEVYGVDSAEVRRYFSYEKTRAGVFGIAHDLFGADIRPWKTAVWAPGVTAWELYDGRGLVGRFYLDPYPREGKYKHMAQFPLRTGIAGRSVPTAALVMNLAPDGPIEHEEAVTFLHEFGHLLHALYSGGTAWASAGMGMIETDFIEAPSQLLEEWAWDAPTLARFAKNERNEPIPADLVARMKRARRFDDLLWAQGNIAAATASLVFHEKAPAQLDFDREWQDAKRRYSIFPPAPGAHAWASFGHLDGYSAFYYTYLWSKAIAVDLFTRFQRAGPRDTATALAYRRAVLEPGSSMPAAQLVEDFLGRPFDLDAYRRRLQGDGPGDEVRQRALRPMP